MRKGIKGTNYTTNMVASFIEMKGFCLELESSSSVSNENVMHTCNFAFL